VKTDQSRFDSDEIARIEREEGCTGILLPFGLQRQGKPIGTDQFRLDHMMKVGDFASGRHADRIPRIHMRQPHREELRVVLITRPRVPIISHRIAQPFFEQKHRQGQFLIS